MDTTIETRDLEEVCRRFSDGRPVAQDVVRRVDAEAAEIVDEIRARHGIVEAAVDLVRESRTRE